MMNRHMSVVIGHSLGSQTSRLTKLISELRPQWTVTALAQSASDLATQLEKNAPDICVLDLGHGRTSSLLLREQGATHPESLLVLSRNAADAAVAFDMEATDFVHAEPLCEERLEAALSRLESAAMNQQRLPGALPARADKRVKFLKVVAGNRIVVGITTASRITVDTGHRSDGPNDPLGRRILVVDVAIGAVDNPGPAERFEAQRLFGCEGVFNQSEERLLAGENHWAYDPTVPAYVGILPRNGEAAKRGLSTVFLRKGQGKRDRKAL